MKLLPRTTPVRRTGITVTRARRGVGLVAAVLGLFAASCGSADGDAPASPRLPELRLVGPGGAAIAARAADDRRLGVRARNGDVVRIETAELHGGLQRGDRVVFDVVQLAGASDTARLSLRPIDERSFAVEATWRTHSFDAPLDALLDGGTVELRVDADDDVIVMVAAPRMARDSVDQPTVVLITSDTHRGDHLSAVSARSPVVTPYLDALAREGLLFTDCFVTINVTIPSHVTLMTGTHPRDTKVVDNRTQLSETATTLAETFRAAGYQTFALASAFLLRDERSGLGQGFDRMNASNGPARDGRETLALASQWLDDAEGAPLFLWVHLFDPHTPYEVRASEFARLAEGRPDPRRLDGDLDLNAPNVPSWLRESGIRDRAFVNRLYGGEVEYLDGALGPFLDHPRIERAALAFTSDHGEALGERGAWWGHFGLQRATLRVPLVLRGPGARGGGVVDAPVRQMDVGRTLIAMAGLDADEFPGRDLREVAAERPTAEPRFALSTSAFAASIELEGWFLEMYLRPVEHHLTLEPKVVGQCALFDLRSDPECAKDLVVDEFERTLRMRRALIEWVEGARVTGMNAINDTIQPEVEARLTALGYVGGYEALVKWWSPDKLDPAWDTSPWKLAFEGGGDPEILRDLIEQPSSQR